MSDLGRKQNHKFDRSKWKNKTLREKSHSTKRAQRRNPDLLFSGLTQGYSENDGHSAICMAPTSHVLEFSTTSNPNQETSVSGRGVLEASLREPFSS